MNNFLVTIKTRGKAYTTQDELITFYDKCKQSFTAGDWSSFVTYELTESKRLHLHTILILPKRIRWTKLLKSVNTNRIYIHLKQFPKSDTQNVINYILKQVPSKSAQDQVLNENYYAHNYGFIE